MDREGRLVQTPAKEIRELRGKRFHIGKVLLKEGMKYGPPADGNQLEVQTEVQITPGARFVLRLRGVEEGKPLEISHEGKTLKVGRQSAEVPLLRGGKLRLRLLVDRSVVEVFANDSAVFSVAHALADGPNGIEFVSDRGSTLIRETTIWPLRSVW